MSYPLEYQHAVILKVLLENGQYLPPSSDAADVLSLMRSILLYSFINLP